MDINKVAILGDEGMGAKLKALFSKAGISVSLSDPKGDYSRDLADADLVLDAFSADPQAVKQVFRKCNEKAPQKAIFASTSPVVTQIAAASGRPDRCLGVNFTANPFDDKWLVEIAKGLETSAESVAAVKNLAKKAGAAAVEMEDGASFILDRVIAQLVNEASYMYTARLATVEDIDGLMKNCANWPMGPFEFADTVGVDKVVATLETLAQHIGPQFIPCPLLKKMVAAGRLGKKSGRGFYVHK